MARYRLMSTRGWGSVIAEAALATAGVDYEIEDVDMEGPRTRLLQLNPLGQLPTLVLPDGRVMTESAAIVLYVNDLNPAAGLAPAAGDAERPLFLRWLVFLVSSIYPTFTWGDYAARFVSGDAEGELRRKTMELRCERWLVVEGAAAKEGPWFLGQRRSAIDLYLAAMTHWRPGREWFAEHCPTLHAIALRADELPAVRKVWQRNFD
jgi:GST-like protein